MTTEATPQPPPVDVENWQEELQMILRQVQEVSDRVGLMLVLLSQRGDVDRRFLNIAGHHLQLGFMCMKRAVERPEGF